MEKVITISREFGSGGRELGVKLAGALGIPFYDKELISMAADDIQGFLYAFFPFLFGVYPYTSHTKKQLNAMEQACVQYTRRSVYDLTKPFAARLLQSFLQKG